MSRGSVDQVIAGEQGDRQFRSPHSFTCSPDPLLSCSIFGRIAAKNRGDMI
jgi:hypothetical protein